jgi:hypothetical protein
MICPLDEHADMVQWKRAWAYINLQFVILIDPQHLAVACVSGGTWYTWISLDIIEVPSSLVGCNPQTSYLIYPTSGCSPCSAHCTLSCMPPARRIQHDVCCCHLAGILFFYYTVLYQQVKLAFWLDLLGLSKWQNHSLPSLQAWSCAIKHSSDWKCHEWINIANWILVCTDPLWLSCVNMLVKWVNLWTWSAKQWHVVSST